MLTKVLKVTSILDDTFDAYATYEELVTFTDAMSWDAIDSIPPYMRPIYQALLDIYSEMEQMLFKEAKEHMENSLVSAAYMMGSTTSLIGMEEFISKETFEWLMNEPLMVRASSLISRAMDDIVGHEVEQERGHVASIIECYMKEYGASKQETYVKFQKEVTNAWKDINKEFFRSTEVPIFVLERALNFARVI
ncbi:hypothetical protein H5410_032436 [Solanum commersonii]|uniref:Terpene synthase metal-binding domain-containing protein n=1 Tax=Solanum commersonii TaxID=4109 RepID=A0A9J5YKZ7_SOLCO|nr:hypothetical protein H5410_032436 [Solanum commersonii]